MRLTELRLKLQRFGKLGGRFFHLRLLNQNRAEIVMQLWPAWFQLDRTPQFLRRPAHIAQIGERSPQNVVRL